jgi:hypothetical protein
MVGIKQIGDQSWSALDQLFFYDTEYRKDGTLVYRKDGVIQAVQRCRGNQFQRDGLKITYSDFTSCPTVFCLPTKSEIIQQLTPDLLELNDGEFVRLYRSIR